MFFLYKKTCFFSKPNPDVVRCVIADVGPLPECSVAIVATGTVCTPVISQKRESKILKLK